MKLTYVISKNDNYMNINELLKVEFKFSARLLSKLIKNKQININDSLCDTRLFYPIGSIIEISLDDEEESENIIPTKMDLDIVYEDEWLIIVNKPSGIATHPSMLHFSDSLSNGMKFYFDSIGLKKKIRPVNRLDLYTSGLVIFAKCEYIQECLIKQMNFCLFQKSYLALAYGNFNKLDKIINQPIGRKPSSIIERQIDLKNGKTAITHYRVLRTFENSSLILCRLKTGRTHQIRVHMHSIGHPLIGDSLYFKPSKNFDGQALHCYKLKFIHPVYHKPMIFKNYPIWKYQ